MKCIDCGTIDPSNPYRILCPKGYGLRSRNAECVDVPPRTQTAILKEIRQHIEDARRLAHVIPTKRNQIALDIWRLVEVACECMEASESW